MPRVGHTFDGCAITTVSNDAVHQRAAELTEHAEPGNALGEHERALQCVVVRRRVVVDEPHDVVVAFERDGHAARLDRPPRRDSFHCGRRVQPGTPRRSISAVPSLLALSTTTISSGTRDWRSMARSVVWSDAFRLCVRTTAATDGGESADGTAGFCPGTGPGRRLARESDGASGFAGERSERAVDLTWSRSEQDFRDECRTWLVEQRPERAAPVGRHPRRLRPAPRVGEAAVRRPLGGGVVARASTAVAAASLGSG